MSYFHYLVKYHLNRSAAVATLLIWALTSSAYALKVKPETVLIGIDANGTRIISNQEDPLFKTEVVNFVRRFFSLLYNFDETTFQQNVGLATELMSSELWAKERPKIEKLFELVKLEKVSNSSSVQSISKTDDGKFQVNLQVSETHRLKSHDQLIQVTIGLKPVPRTKSNPWGMEVESLEEQKL